MDFEAELIERYKNFSYRFLSPKVEKYIDYFESLVTDMKKAGIKMSLLEYISMAAMTSILVFLIEFPLVLIITLFIPNFFVIMGLFFSFSLSLVFSVGIFFFFYIYPSLVVSGRKKDIEFHLPFATLYLATVSGGNIPPKSLFKVISRFEEYGEITREAREITRNVEIFGMSITDALRRAASKSPSDNFKELLWGINTTITSGGSITQYLHEKSRAFTQNYKNIMKEYSKKVSIMIEIYITLIVVGSIFFIVVSSMMSAFGAAMMDMIVIAQFFIVFLGLPLISIVFIIILKYMSPGG